MNDIDARRGVLICGRNCPGLGGARKLLIQIRPLEPVDLHRSKVAPFVEKKRVSALFKSCAKQVNELLDSSLQPVKWYHAKPIQEKTFRAPSSDFKIIASAQVKEDTREVDENNKERCSKPANILWDSLFSASSLESNINGANCEIRINLCKWIPRQWMESIVIQFFCFVSCICLKIWCLLFFAICTSWKFSPHYHYRRRCATVN